MSTKYIVICLVVLALIGAILFPETKEEKEMGERLEREDNAKLLAAEARRRSWK